MDPLHGVADQLFDLAGGDSFVSVRQRSEWHQREHGCGLHHAGAPEMQLVSALVRVSGARSVLDLGCGLGYSTLWLAAAIGPGGSVTGIDDDPQHIEEARRIATKFSAGDRIEYVAGRADEILSELEGPFDAIHDDAWFAAAPDHLDAAIALLRPGALLTMVNWFLLVDALTGQPRNDCASFAGSDWAETTTQYARELAGRPDLSVAWVTVPPVAFATKLA